MIFKNDKTIKYFKGKISTKHGIRLFSVDITGRIHKSNSLKHSITVIIRVEQKILNRMQTFIDLFIIDFLLGKEL